MAAQREKIIIQSPPIRELEKQSSCLKRSCVTGCGCIVVFFIALLLLVFSLVNTRSKQLDGIPDDLTKLAAIYAADQVNAVEVKESTNQNRFIESIAFIPKFIFSPFVLIIDDQVDPNNTRWEQMKEFIQEPVLDARTRYIFTWNNLPATPEFILNYYIAKLERKEFEVIKQSNQRLDFSSKSIDGTIEIIPSENTDTTKLIRVELYIDSDL